ncbi:MAG TPA: EAL domain-containing protein, partial [Acidimicrobiales bacterium]|nr:EAL domain-containing protein [Acidimicrobiales bacterium]
MSDAIAVLVGVLFVDPVHLPLALGCGWATGQLLARRSAYSAAFNVAISLLGAAAATATVHALLVRGTPVGARGAVAVLAGVVVFDMVTGGMVLLHLRACGAPSAQAARTMAAHSALGVPVAAVLSLCAALLVWVDRYDGLIAVALGGLVGVAVRHNGSLRSRVDTLEHLHALAARLDGVATEADVVDAVLAEVRSTFGAEVAELAVGDGATVVRTVATVAGASATRLGGGWRPLEARARRSGPVLAARNRSKHAADLAAAGWRDALLVPLEAEATHGDIGAGAALGDGAVLSVASRIGGATFSRADLSLLEALAVQAGVAIRRSRLQEQVAEETAARQRDARTDPVTGLGNRVVLGERLQAALAPRGDGDGAGTGAGGVGGAGVVLVDLDRFREVNDTLGHDVGDEVLRQVAARVEAAAARVGGTACRVGADEFAIVVAGDGGDRLAAVTGRTATALVGAVGEGLAVAGLALDVGASVGWAAASAGAHATGVLRQADVAMHAAKARGGGACAYDGSVDRHSTRNLQLAGELRKALKGGDLELWYQPKAVLATGAVTGVEGLLRWRHPAFGQVAPEEFITVAERSGLIHQVTWWVIDAALAQLRRWADDGLDLGMAVNISARDLHDLALPAALAERLATSGVGAGRLTLEVTESCVMADPVRSQRVLRDLAALGVRLSIDDFGTGYSSLGRLQTLPIDEVKIDRSFVRDLPAA